MNIIDILLIILILSASTLCIFLIIYLKKLVDHVEAVRKDVHELVEKTTPVFENLDDVTRRVNRIVSEVENYWNEIDSSIKKVREQISGLTSLKRYIDAENPVSELIKNVKAFTKGFITFWKTIKHR
ncbi:MAG: DUF948 domain-containing protein [Ignavibacteriales bacterium]|nr:DUF948 domain-containing protein [Ignavibacteriales bacterium]